MIHKADYLFWTAENPAAVAGIVLACMVCSIHPVSYFQPKLTMVLSRAKDYVLGYLLSIAIAST